MAKPRTTRGPPEPSTWQNNTCKNTPQNGVYKNINMKIIFLNIKNKLKTFWIYEQTFIL